MKVRRSTMNHAFSLFGALALSCFLGSTAPAQDTRTKQHHQQSDKKPSGDLVQAVRESTQRFRDVKVAEAEGYSLLFGCVSGPDSDEAFWKKAKIVMPQVKETMTIRVDADVLEWFRKQGKGYQTRINAILRSYVRAQGDANVKLRR